MNKTTFKPVPEVNKDTLLPPARLTVYPSRNNPGCLSLMLVSDDQYEVVEGGLRLTPEQVESLFYALAEQIGDELFDAGFAQGHDAGHRDGYMAGLAAPLDAVAVNAA